MNPSVSCLLWEIGGRNSKHPLESECHQKVLKSAFDFYVFKLSIFEEILAI
ncbi:unnamed protein product [Acidithrix sp. C25]|nr:unnamed protein product [Acidithrix sp. C25]